MKNVQSISNRRIKDTKLWYFCRGLIISTIQCLSLILVTSNTVQEGEIFTPAALVTFKASTSKDPKNSKSYTLFSKIKASFNDSRDLDAYLSIWIKIT